MKHLFTGPEYKGKKVRDREAECGKLVPSNTGSGLKGYHDQLHLETYRGAIGRPEVLTQIEVQS